MGQHQYVTDVNNNIISRKIEENFSLGVDYALTTVTIASGIVALTSGHFNNYLVATESAAATDDLDTITGGTKGQKLILKAADGDDDVVVKHGTGNILLEGGLDFNLKSTSELVELFYDGTNWLGKGFRATATVAGSLTIASGIVTVTGNDYFLIATESAASTDDLDTISGGVTGRRIVIAASAGGNTVVVKHGTGNIFLDGLADFSLDSLNDIVNLFYNGTIWVGAGINAGA